MVYICDMKKNNIHVGALSIFVFLKTQKTGDKGGKPEVKLIIFVQPNFLMRLTWKIHKLSADYIE